MIWIISRLTLLWRKSSGLWSQDRERECALRETALSNATLQKSFGSREAIIRARPKSEVRTSLNQNL